VSENPTCQRQTVDDLHNHLPHPRYLIVPSTPIRLPPHLESFLKSVVSFAGRRRHRAFDKVFQTAYSGLGRVLNGFSSAPTVNPAIRAISSSLNPRSRILLPIS